MVERDWSLGVDDQNEGSKLKSESVINPTLAPPRPHLRLQDHEKINTNERLIRADSSCKRARYLP